jgi:DNA-binding transcriptional LysR family regulator
MLNQIDLARVDLNLLVLFDTVFAERHVGRAAERLHLSPSAISHGLRRLRSVLNDPLFLKHPKGVVPTARATAIAVPIAAALAELRGVLGAAAPFDPATSTRRLSLGAPDAIALVSLPKMLAAVRRDAPGIDVSVREMLPGDALAALDARLVDVALYPLDDAPARFATRVLYEEEFVIAMRRGHPFARTPTVKAYCTAQHLLVSQTGDPAGFVDRALAGRGLARRVAVTVPSFMSALATVAETDLLVALPRSLAAAYGARFGVDTVRAPIALDSFRIHAVAPRAALEDAGVAWFVDLLERAAPSAARAGRTARRAKPRGRGTKSA